MQDDAYQSNQGQEVLNDPVEGTLTLRGGAGHITPLNDGLGTLNINRSDI